MNGSSKVLLRRTLSISMHAAAFVILAAGFVPIAAVSTVFDVARGEGLIVTRALVFLLWYLTCEMLGIVAAFLIWLESGNDPDLFVRKNLALQQWWTRMLGRGALRIFQLRLDARAHGYRFGQRPVVVFARHASTADAILASLLISLRYGTRLRYVLRRELLWDPCVDIVGTRLSHAFVSDNAIGSAREIAAVQKVAGGLGAGDAIVLHPEGRRSTPARRARAAATLRDHGSYQAARDAEWLQFVLPPNMEAALALLDAAPRADVVFLAHTGFEGSASFDRFFRSGLVGKTVHVELDVIPCADIPFGRDARTDWLMQRWRRIDRFIEDHQQLSDQDDEQARRTARVTAPIRRRDAEPVRLRLVR